MKKKGVMCLALSGVLLAMTMVSGCQSRKANEGKTEIEILQYKPEAATYFDKVEEQFNATHDDIHLTIDSPNDASAILRTRLIREDYPDIIGIGGDINYSYYLDADILMDISDYKGLEKIKKSYLDIDKELEFIPEDGVYGVPYVGNASGILYNREMFKQHGWEIPTTWDELISLCEEIKKEGILPFYFGMKETWTCLAPWNALAVNLAPADVCKQVNKGETTFAEEYDDVADKMQELIKYGQDDPFAYAYNDACTSFANGESAMFTIGSYAVPQIKSVNPDMDIDSFVMPASNDTDSFKLNSGVDLQFCVTSKCENKEAAYEVLDFLIEHENMQAYVDDQNAVPCVDEEFDLAPMLDGMKTYIEEGKVQDYHDHYYPSEMAVDAQIQTFLIKKDKDAFLKKFDKDWLRYNRDIIRKVQDYEAEHGSEK